MCGRPVARSGAPGRAQKYCELPGHTRAKAFAARREIERGITATAGQRAGEVAADRPVSYGRVSFEALLVRFEQVAAEHREQLGVIVAEAADLLGTVGDADAAAYEVAEAHRAAEIHVAQAQTAQAAAERAAAAAIEAQAQADAAAEEALAELETMRSHATEQLAEYQAAAEQAQAGQRNALAELAEVRVVAGAAVTEARQAAEAHQREILAEQDRVLAERDNDMHRQIEQAQVGAQAAAERAAELDRAAVAQLRAQLDTERAEHHRQLTDTRREAHDERAALTRAHAEQLTAVLATLGQVTGSSPDASPARAAPAPSPRPTRRKEQ